MKNKNILAVIGMLLTGTLVSQAVLAAPSATPPLSNLPNAQFNSVYANTNSTFPVYGYDSKTSSGSAGVMGYSVAGDAIYGISANSSGNGGSFFNTVSTAQVQLATGAGAVVGIAKSAGNGAVSGTNNVNGGIGLQGTSTGGAGSIGVVGYAPNSTGIVGRGGANVVSIGGHFYKDVSLNSVDLATSSYAINSVGTNKSNTSTAWTLSSDARLKDVKGEFKTGLEALMKLNPIKFNYKKNNAENLPSNKEMVGLIAQEIQKVIPEAITTDSMGYLQMNTDPIIWTMLNAIKELGNQNKSFSAQLAELQNENSELKAANAKLEARLEKLEAKINLK